MKKIVAKSLIICGIISLLNVVPMNVFAANNSKKETPQIENPEIFGPYMRELQRRVKLNWAPPKAEESTHVTTIFKISKNGKVSALKIMKSSGYTEMDKAAIEAVKKASPFRPLPSEFEGNYVDIQFTFDYNVHKNNSTNDENNNDNANNDNDTEQ